MAFHAAFAFLRARAVQAPLTFVGVSACATWYARHRDAIRAGTSGRGYMDAQGGLRGDAQGGVHP
jgi:hypothetical protein